MSDDNKDNAAKAIEAEDPPPPPAGAAMEEDGEEDEEVDVAKRYG